MTMRVKIDAETCEGHGRCYALAAELFEPDDLGQGVVVGDGVVPEGLEHKAELAMKNCPERAITIEQE